MPIERLFDVRPITKSCFHEIDYQVMRAVFDTHNELGRLYHESLYQSELLAKCLASGLNIISEGEIRLSLHDFRKSYYIDALVESGALYELKAVDHLNERHDAQLLNYLFLSGLSEGKLINFSLPSVEYRFVSTTVSPADRFSFTFDLSEWQGDRSSATHHMVELVDSMVKEWGCFLNVHLYEDAIVHFLGGEKKVRKTVDVVLENRLIGEHPMCLVDDSTGLHVSSIIKGRAQYRKHLERILFHTNLERLVWINFRRNKVQFISLENSPVIK